jgi:hypothetical protein
MSKMENGAEEHLLAVEFKHCASESEHTAVNNSTLLVGVGKRPTATRLSYSTDGNAIEMEMKATY